jgi:Tfp pilus assembly protein PilE
MQARRNGLTLIEVLIIIVMIGILLTITIQKLGNRKIKTEIESLKADVENVRSAESRFFATHNAYGTRLQLDSLNAVTPTAGNTLSVTATANSYTAIATNGATSGQVLTCTLKVDGGETAAQQALPECQ